MLADKPFQNRIAFGQMFMGGWSHKISRE